MLPSIRKQLVYLDQSFLSAACLEADSHKSKNVMRIYSQIKELKARQKIIVVVSDVHSRETSAFPEKHVGNIKKLWQFQNDLAGGCIADDWDEVFVAQWRRILANQDNSNSFPFTDIGLDNPHQLQVGMRIQLTNHWRPKLHRDGARHRDVDNEAFRKIFERQLENMPSCKDVRDCLSYVRELWHKDIRQGIVSWRQQRTRLQSQEHIVNELEAGRIPVIPTWEAPSPFCRIVGEVVQGLEEESTLQRWLELLEGDSANQCAQVRIISALEAALLWKWRVDGAPAKPEKFDSRFGLSRKNDIDHVATFAPYVDVLTTDDSMRNLCENVIVADELKRFPCKIFSKSNYDEFESWLDALLVEPVTHNIRVPLPPVKWKLKGQNS